MKKYLLLCILISCGQVEKAEPQDATLDDVRFTLNELKEEAINYTNQDTGWLANGCDGMLWNGKYAAAADRGDIRASESDISGRFSRTPLKKCWDKKDNGAKSTWSRDMALGFIYWAYRTNNLSVLQDHADYGVANQWKMGDPLGDFRVVYTPQMIGLLYKAIYALGGKANHNRLWPTSWTSGLVDYESHLQVLNIALQGEIAERLKEADAMPRQPLTMETRTTLTAGELSLSVSDTMFKRLEEHVIREPNNAFFQAIYSKYTGNYTDAINLCTSKSVGSYVRCDDNISCVLSELIFSCDFILKQYEGI